MTVQDFVNLWNGLDVSFPNCINNQCITLVHRYVSEVLNIEDISVLAQPTAAQVWTNFQWSQYFTQVPNTPTGIPPEGAIMIFKPTADNNNAGHISVVLKDANINTFNSFDADYPWGTKPHIQQHSYTDASGNDIVFGWLVPTGNLVTQDAVQIADPQQIQQLTDSVNNCQTQLKESTAQAASLQQQLTSLTNQLNSSEENLKDAKVQIATLQAQLDGEQKEIISLNTQIETQAQSNKDYATETLDLTHANTDLTNYLYATADTLGIVRTNKKLADIQEAILEKLSEIDLLLKAAGLAQGLLHQVAKTFSVDAPDDKTAANNIISYVKQLGGKLQSLVPQSGQQQLQQLEQQQLAQMQQPSFWSKFIGFFWQSKST